ncbi:hypothetical protein ES711_08620 [Gelidibacter salicanalis]|uniref:NrS-1 polymerase-like helicase domain-containing protein n=1 Tax=Gelidibacter salicanalis TaxID=291193 RepID=A0A5C7APT4_9FLAO|nr:primase-helicase family protein [Gelidibacter salicanalis]TXE08555.1 hypothetical protein ES711_08620 [Gelidibacter salicanalis]
MLKEVKTSDNLKFWTIDDKGKVTIIQSKLIEFISKSGFAKAETSSTDYLLVQQSSNTVREIADHAIVDFVKAYLIKIKMLDVYEAFIRGSSGYISKAKLRFLNTVEMVNDKDEFDSSWFHFQNLSCQVGKKSTRSILREDIEGKIWESRIIQRECFPLLAQHPSQFQIFCYNLSGKNKDRFLALKTLVGYLLHRNQDPGNARAIIFIDENISFDGTANGGTGKSLLLSAIGKCREVSVMDGKNIKSNSWFKNQRINRTTDVIFYDDVNKDFSLETLYSMITTGITVEKKYQAEVYISPSDAPKICISSNHIVGGTGGSTDIRRRCEFEVSNHYSESYTPADDFGNYFFEGWDDQEWNNFYAFMMHCVQIYLRNGLIHAKPINLKKNGLINITSEDFVMFMEMGLVELNQWISKDIVLKLFIEEFIYWNNMSPHKMTKWMKAYAKHNGIIYEDRKVGERYEFYLKSIKEELSDEEE